MSLAFIPPMLPLLADQPREGDAWLHEIKYDGYRTQLVIEDGETRASTRNGYERLGRYCLIFVAQPP